jgi:hypothetical protein
MVSVLRQLTQLESRMMSIPFPAGGSLYYTNDLEKFAGRTGILLNNESFYAGPDARLHMWYGRRLQLDVDRRPCTHHSLPFLLLNFLELIEIVDESAEAALVAAARKEVAYLEQFGRPLLPPQHERRETHGYKEQSPSDHIKNLERYRLIASSLVPENSALHHFRIRHPDPQPSDVIVSTSSDPNQLKIVGLLD